MTDAPSTLMRSARAATVGVSTLVLARWLWQMRGKRPPSPDGSE